MFRVFPRRWCPHPFPRSIDPSSLYLSISNSFLRITAPVVTASTILTLGIPVIDYAPAQAESATVLRISSNTAQGTDQSPSTRVILGQEAVNISFVQTGEVIQKVWLDNPSRIVLDFDGCLLSQMGEDGHSSNSNGCNGASIIHLRQLPTNVGFPTDVFPESRAVSLTVITSGNGANRKLYHFNLVLAAQTQYRLIEILPSPAPSPAQLTNLSQEYQRTVLSQISRGLAYAEANKMIDTTHPNYARVRTLIALMQNGSSYIDARKQSNTPEALIDKLRALGNKPQPAAVK